MYKKSSVLVLVLFFNIAIGSVMADPNLIGWWKFDSVSNGIAVDSSGNGFNGTINGNPAQIAGVDGSALAFDGVDDYVNIPTSVFSTIQNEITIILWQNRTAGLTLKKASVFEGKNGTSRILNVHLPWGDTGTDGTVYWDAGYSTYDRCSKVAGPNDYSGQWTLWIFTKNASTGDMNIYRNGELWNATSEAVKPISNITTFRIGSGASGDNFYDGMIDEVNIYNRELSEYEIRKIAGLELQCTPTEYDLNGDCLVDFEDVAQLAQNWLLSDFQVLATPPSTSSMQAFYMFSSITNKVISDSSGKQRHATVEANDTTGIIVPGFSGNCISLNGTFGISIPASVFSSINNGMTIAVSINTGADLVSAVDFAAGPNDANLWDKVSWQPEDVNNSGTGWIHYAFVKDPGSNVMRIYRNGLIIAHSSHAMQPLNGTQAGVSYIGASSDGKTDFFVGMIDNFRVYNYALSQAEILYLAQGSGSQITQPISPYLVPIDPHKDGKIDYKDFTILAEKWMNEIIP